MPLPSALAFLSSLFDSPAFSTSSNGSPLSSETTPIFLTLHCLFPSDLLPALDLLDRRLVTRFVLDPLVTPAGDSVRRRLEEPPLHQENNRGGAAVYYVRSSRRSRYSGTTAEGAGTNYEVRLQAWNCTCPAFVFAAFRPQNEDLQGALGNDDEDDHGVGARTKNVFGGLSLGEQEVPVCKHLLACLLVEMGGIWRDFVNETAIGREEMARWAAGWGG